MTFRHVVHPFAFALLVALACGPLAAAPAPAARTGEVDDPAQLVPNPTGALLLDLATAGQRHFAAGAHGVIVASDDLGTTWTQQSTPTSDMLTCIGFADAQRGWSAGHQGVLLGTSDAGGTWTPVAADTTEDDSFLDVLALPDGPVIAVGAYGLYLRSTDRGATWVRQNPLEEDLHLNRITAGPSGSLYLAGESGTLARSRDSGETWERLEAPYEGSFYGLHELASGQLLAHGLRGHVFVSTDSGATWSQSTIEQTGLIASAAELPGGGIAVSGAGGLIYLSQDGGRTFAKAVPTGLTAVAEIRPSGEVLLCVGDVGVRTIRLPNS